MKTREFLAAPYRRKLLSRSWEGFKSVGFCREHLIQHFKEGFLTARQRMVVVYPNLEEKNGNYQYCFVTLKEIEQGYAPDEATNNLIIRLIRGWLDSIQGQCGRCSFKGEVAYFGKEAVKWEKVPGFLGAPFDYPMIHEIRATPEILCRSCAFKNIENSFRTPGPGFNDGVFCPRENEEGIYVTVEV
jgi:hypothetical protein